jgi:hypothetical protein
MHKIYFNKTDYILVIFPYEPLSKKMLKNVNDADETYVISTFDKFKWFIAMSGLVESKKSLKSFIIELINFLQNKNVGNNKIKSLIKEFYDELIKQDESLKEVIKNLDIDTEYPLYLKGDITDIDYFFP